MLICKNLSAYINSSKVFKNLSFCLKSSSALFLKGNNGSGKTTFLKILAGINQPSSGIVTWRGVNIFENIEEFQNTQMAYLGHNNGIKLELTVLENLLFWADIKNTHELIAPALSHFGISDLLETKCALLSAGQKRRVALTRLIILNAKLWLLDEPENQLDEDSKKRLMQLISVKVSEGGTVIIATHNLDQVPETLLLDMSNFR